MNIQAKVNVINEVRTGVSQSNGYEWQSQDIVISWTEQLPDGRQREEFLLVTLHGESVNNFAKLCPVQGETIISGSLDFRTRSYNGKVYNDISLTI